MKRERRKRLNPTLWRTCRVLTGATRLALLRRLLRKPGQTVSQLAEAERVSMPRASQELRRLQSRGLLRAERRRGHVRYHPDPDPQVATARPILAALGRDREWLATGAAERIRRLAAGASYERRLDLLRELKKGPRDAPALRAAAGQPAISLYRHLYELRRCGWVTQERRQWRLAANGHPLARGLRKLI